jgi:hypothetical protein
MAAAVVDRSPSADSPENFRPTPSVTGPSARTAQCHMRRDWSGVALIKLKANISDPNRLHIAWRPAKFSNRHFFASSPLNDIVERIRKNCTTCCECRTSIKRFNRFRDISRAAFLGPKAVLIAFARAPKSFIEFHPTVFPTNLWGIACIGPIDSSP